MNLPSEPRWVPEAAVIAFHHQQILEHGGLQGMRSDSALCSALARPKQRWSFGELTSIPLIAAAHAEAIVVGHPFSDGNKRTGFLVAVVFLGLNGFAFKASNAAVVQKIQQLAGGLLAWPELEAWFVASSVAK